MSDITIFKLEDLGIDLFEDHTIKVKSKKNGAVSSFSNELSYPQIPHHKVTVYHNYSGSSSGSSSVELFDGASSNSRISRGYIEFHETKTVPITQGQIYCYSSGVTFYNPTTGETGNPYTVSSDIKLNLIKKS